MHNAELPRDHDLVTTTFAPMETLDVGAVRSSSVQVAARDVAKLEGAPDTNPKTVYGLQKPSTFAVPPVALFHLGQAMENGRQKYGLMNWRDHAVSASVYFNAIDRHLRAWQDGENSARDSGCHHLAHVMACCAIILDALECGQLIDDRSKPGPAPAWLERMTRPFDRKGTTSVTTE